jgi:hypothetical protein
MGQEKKCKGGSTVTLKNCLFSVLKAIFHIWMPPPHSTSDHASCCGVSDPHYKNVSLSKNFVFINLTTPHHFKHYPLSQKTAHKQFPTFSHLLSVCQVQSFQNSIKIRWALYSSPDPLPLCTSVYLQAHKAKRRGLWFIICVPEFWGLWKMSQLAGAPGLLLEAVLRPWNCCCYCWHLSPLPSHQQSLRDAGSAAPALRDRGNSRICSSDVVPLVALQNPEEGASRVEDRIRTRAPRVSWLLKSAKFKFIQIQVVTPTE